MIESSKVITLSESIKYPEGNNHLIIEGTGDEETISLFSTVTMTGPTTMSSDGVARARVTASVYDPNTATPFARETVWERVNADKQLDNRFTVVTGLWAHHVFAVYEYNGGDNEENYNLDYPVPWELVQGKKILIASGYVSPITNKPGLAGPDVIVHYRGGPTMTFRVGQQEDERWWEEEEDEGHIPKEGEVTGKMYYSALGDELYGGEVPIPETSSQQVSVSAYFMPTAGDYGVAYTNAEYSGVPAEWIIGKVTMGLLKAGGLTLEAETPIPPGGDSIVLARVSDYKGSPVMGEIVKFFIHSGGGTLIGAEAETGEVKDFEEEVTTGGGGADDGEIETLNFSVQHPATAVKKIETLPDASPPWTWNGKATIQGTSIYLEEDNAIPLTVFPITVTYDYGGEATCLYRARDEEYTAHIGAMIGGLQDLTQIEVQHGAGEAGTISITADPGSIEKGGESNLTIEAFLVSGEPAETGQVKLTKVGGGSISGFSMKEADREDSDASINSKTEVSVNGEIESISEVRFPDADGDLYSVDSFEDSTIYLSAELPVFNGSCYVKWTKKGTGGAVFNGPDKDELVYINASLNDPEADYEIGDTCEIQVGLADPADANLTITPYPAETVPGGKVRLIVQLGTEEAPEVGEEITLEVVSGPGLVRNKKVTVVASVEAPNPDYDPDAEPDPLADPVEETTLVFSAAEGQFYTGRANPGGKAAINATWKTATASCTVDVVVPTDPDEPTFTTPIGKITGEIRHDTWPGSITSPCEDIQGGHIKEMGAGDGADEFGGTNTEPLDEPIILGWSLDSDVFPWDLRGITVEGAEYIPDENPNFNTGIFIGSADFKVPWDYEGQSTKFKIEVKGIEAGVPASGVKVTIASQSSYTDKQGVAEFSNLPPGTHGIGIQGDNWKWNKELQATGHGVVDDNENNREVTIANYSDKAFKLLPTKVNITINAIVKQRKLYEGLEGYPEDEPPPGEVPA